MISVRFSFSRKLVTSTGTWTCTAAVFSFIDSSCTMRRICSALDSVSRMWLGAVAARAGDVAAFAECRAQALTAQLQQAELADAAELNTCAIRAQCFAEPGLDLAAVLRLIHVDEVDDDQAAQVAQAHLARDLVGRFEVGAGRGFLDVGTPGRTRGVHVDRNQGLGVVDHDRAPRWQVHGA